MIIYHRFQGTDAVGRSWGFGWHSLVSDSLTASHARAQAWFTSLFTALESYYAIATTTTKVTSYLLNTVAPYKSTNALANPISIAGTDAGKALPAQVAVVCSLGTPQTGRAFRGRFYMPAPAQSASTTSGEFPTAARDAFLAAFVTAFTGSNSAAEVPGVFSKTTGILTPYSEILVGDKFDTQRKRVAAVVPSKSSHVMP